MSSVTGSMHATGLTWVSPTAVTPYCEVERRSDPSARTCWTKHRRLGTELYQVATAPPRPSEISFGKLPICTEPLVKMPTSLDPHISLPSVSNFWALSGLGEVKPPKPTVISTHWPLASGASEATSELAAMPVGRVMVCDQRMSPLGESLRSSITDGPLPGNRVHAATLLPSLVAAMVGEATSCELPALSTTPSPHGMVPSASTRFATICVPGSASPR